MNCHLTDTMADLLCGNYGVVEAFIIYFFVDVLAIELIFSCKLYFLLLRQQLIQTLR